MLPRRVHVIVASTALAAVCLAGSSAQESRPQEVPPIPVTPGAKPSVAPAQEARPPAAPPQDAKPPQTRLRSGVDLVSLSVTVMDGTRYVSDLEESTSIYEDGAKQAITFSRACNADARRSCSTRARA
jgi:hypothetical protein